MMMIMLILMMIMFVILMIMIIMIMIMLIMAMFAIDVLMILIMNIPLIYDHETYDHHQCNQHENHNEYVEELKLEWNLLDLGFVCQSHPNTIWVGSETCQDIIVLIFQHSYSDIECKK